MQFGEPAHKGKPKSGSTCLAVVAIVDLAERREDLVELLAWNSRPVVLHRDLETAASRRFRAHHDAPTFRREFHRVGAQVDQDLLQCAFVGIEWRTARIDLRSEEHTSELQS